MSLSQTLRPILAAAIIAAAPAVAIADDLPTFRVELRDGTITPSRIEVPANTRIKLELHNLGTSPAEFECLELRKERVLGPGAQSFMVIHDLEPGEYSFFDEFHPDGEPAVLAAR